MNPSTEWATDAVSAHTRALIDFICTTTPADLPAAVVAESKRNILDFLGVSIGGSDERAVRIALEHVRDAGGTEQATIPVTGDRTNIGNVALMLGIMGHVLDFDDSHLPTILHGTTPVMSALLPVTEWLGRSGTDLITAYAIGFETAARTALALHPDHYDTGWHVTGTAGAIGAAAGTAHLLRLGREETAYALGMAATQAAGHREHFGSMSKSFGVGKAGSNGVLAALLASRGYDSALDGLEGRRGMFAVMGGAVHPEALDADLGKRWELFQSGLKPYPCGIVTHPAIDAAFRIRAEHHPEPADIEAIEVRVHPLVLELTNKHTPRTGLEGKFSVAFTIAAALCRGRLMPVDFAPEVLDHPDVARVRQLVRLTADSTLPESEAHAVVRTSDGRTLTADIEVATGMPGNPMPESHLHAKFHGLVDPVLGSPAAGTLIGLVDALDSASSVTEIVRHTVTS
jgi:2-methylcitrate dehydratase PrpD